MKVAIAALNGLIALLLAVPGLGYLLTPVFRKGAEEWVAIGTVAKFRSPDPQKATFSYVAESGYTRAEKKGFVWVLAAGTDSGSLTVYSPVCSHTGCNVAWRSAENLFVCPCHGGRYDRRGEVVSGPPPRPLEKLPVKITRGEVFIQLPV